MTTTKEPDEAKQDDGAGAERPASARWSRGPRLGWVRLLVLALALLCFGGALGFSVPSLFGNPGEDSADVGYLQDMITHHEQALVMAQYQLTYGERSEVKIFAREILERQSYEIGLMEAKLREWGYRREDRPPTAMAWMGMGMPVESMPGLASEDQMDALRQATGAEADRLFLELMATHHRGGADMGRAGAERATDDWVKYLADLQARNQIIEINEFIVTAEWIDLDVNIEPYE